MIFSSPTFFWALGILAIPIIIHLFRFRRYKVLFFSDISLLKEVQTRSQTKNRLKHYLILSTRLIALALLVAAFADPIIPSEDAKDNQDAVIAIYVDNSLSMQNQSDAGTLLAQAKQDAYEVMNAYPRDTRFQLITNELSANQLRYVDGESFLTMLDEVSFTPQFRSIDQIHDFHIQAKREEEAENSRLYLLSDFIGQDTNQFKRADSLNTRLIYSPYKGIYDRNLSIDSAWVDVPTIQSGKELTLYMRIHNHGGSDVSDLPVELLVNGGNLGSILVNVEAKSFTDTSFTFIAEDTNDLQGILSLDDSPITFDNNLYFTLNVQPTIRVVEIQGSDIESSPFSLLFDSEEYDYIRMPEGQVLQSEIDQADLLIFNGVSSWKSGFFASISERTRAGNNVLIVTPKELDSESLTSLKNELGLTSLEWDTSRLEANRLAASDMLFKNVFEAQTENMNFPYVKGHWSLKSAATEPIISLFNGDPLLGSIAMNNARVFVITAPLQTAYTNLHRHALFVPALLNMSFFSGTNEAIFYWVGTDKIDLAQKLPETVKLQALNDSFQFLPGITYDGILLNGLLQKDGYYALVHEDKRLKLLAFNYQRKESLLSNPAWDSMEEKLGSRLLTLQDGAPAKQISAAQLDTKLWPWFILLSLGFILLESLLIKLFRT